MEDVNDLEDPHEDIQNGWDWNEEDGERCIPRVTRYRAHDPTLLNPPPIGWSKVFDLPRLDHFLPDFRDIAMWTALLAVVQDWEHKRRYRFARTHMICRTIKGGRVLAVAPELHDLLFSEVEDLNAHLNGDASHCGGWETIEEEVQIRAARVFLRRDARRIADRFVIKQILASEDLDPEFADWQDLDVADRVKLAELTHIPLEVAMSARDWTDAMPADSIWLARLAEKVREQAGGPPADRYSFDDDDEDES